MSRDKYFELFLQFSEFSTGFDQPRLWGTGVVKNYYDAVEVKVGSSFLHKMLEIFGSIKGRRDEKDLFYTELFFSAEYRSLVKGIINLWYTGLWCDEEGEPVVLSSESYLNGLMWNVVGAHVLGGKPYGYGSWAEAPV